VQVGVAQILALTETALLWFVLKEIQYECHHSSGDCGVLSMPLVSGSVAADAKSHRVSIQVDQNDPQVMNLALNNATNIVEYYRGKNEDVDVDIVTYGPGLHMLRDDTSPVKDRIKASQGAGVSRKIQFRRAITPSKTWRRPRARLFRSSPMRRSCLRVSSA